jgi:ankyrin repeat protein
VKLLLRYRADPNARAHPSGWTPLHDAAYSNSIEVIRLLLEAGAVVDAHANSGATPLCFAAQEDAAEAATLLLRHGADLSKRCEPCLLLNSNASSPLSGYTPLHYCARFNAVRAAQVLLSNSRAPIAMDTPDCTGRLPIHIACMRGSSNVLYELLHFGARVDACEPNDRSRAIPASLCLPSFETFGANEVKTAPNFDQLRLLIPSQPIQSDKPWNCLTKRSIDKCHELICLAKQGWSPLSHALFTPSDRMAVVNILIFVAKGLEQQKGVFLDLWPLVLSFCGRGWFDAHQADGY